jgi:putative isomerase
MSNYEEMKKDMIRGWNTWNNNSVMSYVYMPHGFAINVGIKEHELGTTWAPRHLKNPLIGRSGAQDEKIHPGAHSYDGCYTELNLKWRNMEMLVQSAVLEDELVVLLTPLRNQKYPVTVVIESGVLWNRKGTLEFEEPVLRGYLPGKTIEVHTTGKSIFEPNVNTMTPYIAVDLDKPVGISTGRKLSVEEIELIIRAKKMEHESKKERYGALAEVYNAMQSCMAWDSIYEPKKDRVITPVSRLWNINWGGYVLFCWDTYFGAYLAAFDNKELAYSNAIEVTKEKTENGFVGNFASDCEIKSRDRSQPPVGSITVKEIYRKYRDKWFLEEVYDDLLVWNKWWEEHRQIEEGFLAWGSDPYEAVYGGLSEIEGVNDTKGGAYESGLDNSPMYDDIPFDKDKHCMKLADVGLMGLYIADCNALAEIADILGKTEDADELRKRSEKFSKGLMTLWDEETGMFLNKRTDTGEFSYRMSPTNFYALYSSHITKEQARRMVTEHFYNPDEFWGEWIMPAISRNDPAFKEQFYWRGRIWAPMNFLAYLALRNHGLSDACKDLAEKSKNLLLKEWTELGHIHENYCALTGEGCNSWASDRFYHWGALLSLIALMEAGFMDGPEKPLSQ